MTVANDILRVVMAQPGLSAEGIAGKLFGDKATMQRVNAACRKLVEERRLVRRGRGGPSDPLTYHLPTHPSILTPT